MVLNTKQNQSEQVARITKKLYKPTNKKQQKQTNNTNQHTKSNKTTQGKHEQTPTT